MQTQAGFFSSVIVRHPLAMLITIKAGIRFAAHYGFRKLMLRVSPVVFERRLPAALFFAER
ncbi:hypothetical protein [Jeongeupia sp. HS-3]|uniref:hypothetical protein n=1 Tax=Jeongeupia sp. HS-3 TaxID=1009682 RepID=UPI0019104AB1|nr:hypothetical protein [Jeongeupia sp. HS-3]